jgi:hypothetical protein
MNNKYSLLVELYTMINKDYKLKSKEEIDRDITTSFFDLIRDTETSSIIKIDLTKTNDKSIKDYNFRLRKMFNSIRKKHNDKKIDYLFVIEIPENISKTKYMIPNKNIIYHSHIVLNTNISIVELLKEIKICFNELKSSYVYKPNTKMNDPDLYLEEITTRPDRRDYYNYLIKQKTLTNYSYNYKIKKSD